MIVSPSVAGKVALVTGGGISLAGQGADVVLAGRRPEPLDITASEIVSLGRKALAVSCDIATKAECERLVAATLAKFGRLDILINCAGGAPMKGIDDWTDPDWQEVIALNLEAVWNLSRLSANAMIACGGGSIVNISSGASLRPMPMSPIYAAAKSGVNSLTNSLAAAWTPKGVRVNAIAVGAVAAPTLTDELDRLGIDHDKIARGNALARLGEPEEIAAGALFFASDMASFCSGQTLLMHGGPVG
jgi:NAD(P)-dependent dehydrogenase (short-subunit alcohol dehydrogenase family)